MCDLNMCRKFFSLFSSRFLQHFGILLSQVYQQGCIKRLIIVYNFRIFCKVSIIETLVKAFFFIAKEFW